MVQAAQNIPISLDAESIAQINNKQHAKLVCWISGRYLCTCSCDHVRTRNIYREKASMSGLWSKQNV